MLPLALLLAGCAVPSQLDFRALGRDASGATAGTRLLPPGLDLPTPNLAMVPPVPDRPDTATRDGLTRRLEADRARSLAPLPPRDAPAPPQPEAPGRPPIAAAPPPPPRLTAATPVPWQAPRGAVVVPMQPLGEPLSPGAVPALPPPELLAPAPPSR